MSDASFLADVDMAQDDIFSGPVSESVPSSTVGFMHRGSRRDSIASFTYYDEDENHDSDSWLDEEAILDEAIIEDGEGEEHADAEEGEEHEEHENGFGDYSEDIDDAENGRPTGRRKSSGLSRTSNDSRRSRRSRASTEDPLLKRHDSSGSGVSGMSARHAGDRATQKLYIQSEDLTIVIAGFKTSILGFSTYTTLCIVTCGLAYLLFRWLPRWRVKLVGAPIPLHSCDWVVIEVSSTLFMLPTYLSVDFGVHRTNGGNWLCKTSPSQRMDRLCQPSLALQRDTKSLLTMRTTTLWLRHLDYWTIDTFACVSIH